MDMNYKETLEAANAKLKALMPKRETLVAQLAAIDREMQALTRIMEAAKIALQDSEEFDPTTSQLIANLPNPEAIPAGFTDCVRLALRRSQMPLFPTEIRDRLDEMGIEGTSPKNFLIHVHKVLERLLEAGEITEEKRDGKIGYRALTTWEMMTRNVGNYYLKAFNSYPPLDSERKKQKPEKPDGSVTYKAGKIQPKEEK